MAIHQYASLSFSVYGDGVSTVQTVDFTKQLESPASFGPIVNSMTDGFVVLQTPTLGGGITSTAVVSGNQITFTWSSAPPAAQAGATVLIGY
jgi:hypothetical protein